MRKYLKLLALLAALLVSHAAYAGLAVDSQETGTGSIGGGLSHHSATSPLTWSFTNTAGNVLVVGLVVTGTSGTATAGAVSYNGVSLGSPVASILYSANNTLVNIYCLANPATGAHTVSLAGSMTTLVDILGGAISFSGGNTTTPCGNGTTATGTSTASSVTVVGTVNGDFVVSAAATGTSFTGVTAPTVVTNSANVTSGTAGDNLAMGQQSTTGGNVAAAFTQNNDLFGIAAVELFLPAAAAKPFRTLMGVGQ